mgnify:CR=1 FL=1
MTTLRNLTLGIAAIAALGAIPAHAQSYPNQSVKMVVPFGPGSTTARPPQVTAKAGQFRH